MTDDCMLKCWADSQYTYIGGVTHSFEYSEGYIAYLDGKLVQENPYDFTNYYVKYREWNSGFSDSHFFNEE